MKFYVDGSRNIGTSHSLEGKPCQDAVQFGVIGDEAAAYAIACDGCSRGGRTDLGSEVYARATAQAIEHQFALAGNLASEEVLSRVLHDQRIRELSARDQLRLPREDMLSTAVLACACSSGGMAHIQGDGVIAMVDDQGLITMQRTDWGQNAPAYPAYRDDNYAHFISFQGGNLDAVTYMKDENSVICHTTTEAVGQMSDPMHFEENHREVSLGEALKGTTFLFDETTLATLRTIAVFSDGVTRMKRDGTIMDWREVVVALLQNLKPGRKAFATKRLNMFLQKNTPLDGDGPDDDIAYSVILVEPEKEN